MSLLKTVKNKLAPSPLKVPDSIAIELNNHTGVDKQDIITFSTQDWSDLWTRKQRFSLQFARQGNTVVYVETQFHWLSYIKQFQKQWRRIYQFMLGPRKVEDNLYVYTPPLLLPAFQIFPFLAKINNIFLGSCLKKVLSQLNMHEPVMWLYTHYNQPLVKMLGAKTSLYECVDDYAGATGLIKPSVVRKQEAATLRTAAASIVTADSLKPLMTPYNDSVHIINNAANQRHFNSAVTSALDEPQDIAHIKHPRLVFLGMVQYWVDQKLIETIAKNKHNWQLLFIGPVVVDVSSLHKYDNIHFIGRREYDSLPAYMAHCDVALNPYHVDDVAKGCSPLKLYEYLAAGLPVVSTEMPEARKFERVVTIGRNYDDYIRKIDSFLQLSKSEKTKLRDEAVELSKEHSWENRFLKAETILKEALTCESL